MKKIMVLTILSAVGLFFSTHTAFADEIITKNELADIMVYGIDSSKNPAISKPASKFLKISEKKNNKVRNYKFIKITDCDQGYFPTINNLDEIYYEKYDEKGNPNIYSNEYGWMTNSTTGNLRFPDANDNGEIVYSDLKKESNSFQIFSNKQGWIADKGNTPSINNLGEIVYWDAYTTSSSILSIERGILYSSTSVKNPEINDFGEVVFQDLDSNGIWQIYSTIRGCVTNFEEEINAGTPTIGNDGEIFYIASDINGVNQLFSNKSGQITDENSFPEPNYDNPWTGEENFGLYSNGIGYFPDTNDNGKIVFGRILVEGPYCEIVEERKECFGYACIQVYLAVPVEENIVEIEIDILPMSDSSCISINGFGYIPAALMGSKNFDVTEVDIESITLETIHVARSKFSNKFLAWQKDINNDGFDDLYIMFDDSDMSLKALETITLSGQLQNKTLFSGNDRIYSCRD